MELQSLVIGSDEIELSLGKRDGGREYMFVRLPLPDDEYKHLSINDVHLDRRRARVSERVPQSLTRNLVGQQLHKRTSADDPAMERNPGR